MISFVHMADMHIDKRMYTGKAVQQRRDDFANVWLDICTQVAEFKPDFMLIAGDLFDRSMTREWGRSVARAGLETIKKDGIPVIAIWGNHDGPDTVDGLSLLHELEELRLLTLLSTGQYRYQLKCKSGEFATIYGVPWAGAASARVLSEIDLQEFDGDFNILMAHCGVEGLTPVNFPETVSRDIWRRFTGYVDYIALGHVHKPFYDGWMCMPGSPETCKRDEYYLEAGAKLIVAEASRSETPGYEIVTGDRLDNFNRRPYIVQDIPVDRVIGSKHKTVFSDQPVISIKVTGDRQGFSWQEIEDSVKDMFEGTPLYFQIIDGTEIEEASLEVKAEDSREIEQEVFRGLLDERLAAITGEVIIAVLDKDYQGVADKLTEVASDL